MRAVDKTEFHLLEICRAGTDSITAIDFLDGVMAIICRDDRAHERMLAIGCFLRRRYTRAVTHERQPLAGSDRHSVTDARASQAADAI
jgi:hypothetical protein